MRPALAVVIFLASLDVAVRRQRHRPRSAPGTPPPPGDTLILSGMVFELSPTGRRPIAGATVEIAESTFGDINTRPTTDQNGRYAFNGLTPHRQEVRAILPRHRLPVDETDIGLVDERRRLQAVSHAFARHAASRDLAQFLMHQRDQLLAGRLVAPPPLEEEPGDAGGVVSSPQILGVSCSVLTPVLDAISRNGTIVPSALLGGPRPRSGRLFRRRASRGGRAASGRALRLS